MLSIWVSRQYNDENITFTIHIYIYMLHQTRYIVYDALHYNDCVVCLCRKVIPIIYQSYTCVICFEQYTSCLAKCSAHFKADI